MKSSMSLHRHSPPTSDRVCSHCKHAGCDVRIKGCGNGCAYHARCLDLAAIVRHRQTPSPPSPAASLILIAPTQEATTQHCQQQQRAEPLAQVTRCPSCSRPASGLEIVPLSFAEIDEAQLSSGGERPSGGPGGDFVAQPGKRMHASLLAGSSSSPTSRGPSCYDPTAPRTGKWSDEEIAFREEIVMHFMEGSLPLPEGLKLIEFLGSMLKSKPSRLTKKMKRAKLSTRHFIVDSGFVRSAERARVLSMLELAFVDSVPHPVERSEIRFHMQHEWRGRLAERLTYLRVAFDAEEWLGSVDAVERRVAFAKSLRREVKRRHMTGVRSTEGGPGDDARPQDQEDFDLELLASALESNESDDAELVSGLYSGLAAGGASVTAAASASVDSSKSQSDDIHRSPGTPSSRSPSLSSQSLAEGPNFRFAAPFLAKITAYIEKNRVPFEHIDSWVPSSADTSLEPSVLGSNGADAGVEARGLCFAGSATASVPVAPDGPDRASLGWAGYRCGGPEPEPLSLDEINQLSLFGSYSEKFSFSSGRGLPGRVYETGVAAWEQFVADAPPDMFERRGGAMQFGIKTALGLPIRSPNVGRVVVVLYSRHNREKDAGLVARMVSDFQGLNPSPRWKLMVDIGNAPGPSSASMTGEQEVTMAVGESSSSVATAVLHERNVQVSNLLALLGENMPSDQSTPLGQQLHNIMSLRFVLLRRGRTPQDKQLLDSILTLFESYVQAGRSPSDTTLLLARDFAFHSAQQIEQHPTQLSLKQCSVQQHSTQEQSMHQYSTEQHSIRQPQQQVSQQQQVPPSMPLKRPPLQHQLSIPAMQLLPQGEAILEHQWQPPRQLDHTHHGQQPPLPPLPQDNSSVNVGRGQSFCRPHATADNARCLKTAAVANSRQMIAIATHEGGQSTPVTSLTERNSPNPDLELQPRASPGPASQIPDPPKGDAATGSPTPSG